MTENEDQKALRCWIEAGMAIPEVRDLKGDAGYLLANMIAKYTLAASEYMLSVKAIEELQRMGKDLDATHTRSSLYGKKKPFIFEHAVPATIVRDFLLNGRCIQTVGDVLAQAGPVAVLLRSEDELLKKVRLDRRMPDQWKWGDDVLARYSKVGIELSRRTLAVKGKIKR